MVTIQMKHFKTSNTEMFTYFLFVFKLNTNVKNEQTRTLLSNNNILSQQIPKTIEFQRVDNLVAHVALFFHIFQFPNTSYTLYHLKARIPV